MDKENGLIIKKLIGEVNKTLTFYKSGGWIDAMRIPDGDHNIVSTLEEYVEARFNCEAWYIPELHDICDCMDGYAFKCHLTGADEEKRKYELATLDLIKKDQVSEEPTQELIDNIEKAKKFLGGNRLCFSCHKLKIKVKIDNV